MIGFRDPVAGVAAALLSIAAWLYATGVAAKRWYTPRHPLLHLVRPRRATLAWRWWGTLAALLLISAAIASPYATVRIAERVEASVEVPVGVKPRPAVVFVLDVSGSMSGWKLEEAKRAVLLAAKQALSKGLDVGLVAFSDDIQALLAPTGNYSRLEEVLERLEANGGTMYSAAFSAAYSIAVVYHTLRTPIAIVFVTDGLPGDTGLYEGLVEKLAALHVPVYTVYVGGGSPGPLAWIAGETGGKLFTTDRVEELAELLPRATRLAAERIVSRRAGIEEERTVEIDLAPHLALAAAALSTLDAVAAARKLRVTL